MSRVRALIVDDEPLSRRAMRQLLDARGDVHVVAECPDATSAEVCLRNEGADVVFLDIQMPRRSGLDLARRLPLPRTGPPFVVFVTAYDEYAVPAFETEALDFLSKPVPADRLEKTMARLRERLRAVESASPAPADSPDHLLTRVGDRDVIIPIDDIDSIEADGVYAGVTVGDRRYLVRSSLDALARTLSASAFVRVHRSWIVPRDRIALVRPSAKGAHREIVLRSGSVVPVSRRRQSLVMRLLRGR